MTPLIARCLRVRRPQCRAIGGGSVLTIAILACSGCWHPFHGPRLPEGAALVPSPTPPSAALYVGAASFEEGGEEGGVDLLLTLVNPTETPLIVHTEDDQIALMLDFQFTGPHGGEVPPTPYLQAIRRSHEALEGMFGASVIKIPPGGLHRFTLRLDRLFDLSLQGRYRLAIRTPAIHGEERIHLSAGPVEFEIAPPASNPHTDEAASNNHP